MSSSYDDEGTPDKRVQHTYLTRMSSAAKLVEPVSSFHHGGPECDYDQGDAPLKKSDHSKLTQFMFILVHARREAFSAECFPSSETGPDLCQAPGSLDLSSLLLILEVSFRTVLERGGRDYRGPSLKIAV